MNPLPQTLSTKINNSKTTRTNFDSDTLNFTENLSTMNNVELKKEFSFEKQKFVFPQKYP